MKRLMIAILCLLLAAALPALAAGQAVVYTADGYEYTVNADGTAAIFRYLGSADAPAVPQALDGRSVTGIGALAFCSLSGIRSVILPDSVTAIAPGAFACKNLQRILVNADSPAYAQIDGVLYDKIRKMLHTFPVNGNDKTYVIPVGVLLIGEKAFENCAVLTSVKIPESVKRIEDSAFSGCSELKTLTINAGLTAIGNAAFSGCLSLTAAELPATVANIGESAFAGCVSLVSVMIPGSVTAIGTGAFAGCANLTLIVERGSYAAQYAQSHGIPYQYPVDWL